MLKKLSARHYEAARMIWSGASHTEVAEALNVTVNAVKSWGRSDIFKAEINRLQDEQNKRVCSDLDSAAEFQAEVREKTRALYHLCYVKLETAIESLDPEMPLYRGFPPLIKAAKELTELALYVDEATLGLEALAKEIDAINKTQTAG